MSSYIRQSVEYLASYLKRLRFPSYHRYLLRDHYYQTSYSKVVVVCLTMRASKSSLGALHSIIAITFLLAFCSVRIYAIDKNSYDDYLEAENLPNRGTESRDLQAIHEQPDGESQHCEAVGNPLRLHCRLDYGRLRAPSQVPPTSATSASFASSATPEVSFSTVAIIMPARISIASSLLDEIITPQSSQSGSKVLKQPRAQLNQPTAPPPRIRYNVHLMQEIIADAVSMSFDFDFQYNAFASTLGYTTTITASMGTQETAQFLSTCTSSISPVPSETQDVQNISKSGFYAAMAQFTSVLDVFDRHSDNTLERPYNTISVNSGIVKGGMQIYMQYYDVTAKWTAIWGPYDIKSLGYEMTVTSVEVGTYASAWVTQTLNVKNPYYTPNASNANALPDPRHIVRYIPVEPTPVGESTLPTIGRRGRPTYYPTTIARRTDIPLVTRAVTVTRTASRATKTIASTKTITENPRAPVARARKQLHPTKTQTLFALLPWVFAFWVLVLICTVALMWDRICKVLYRFKLRDTPLGDDEAADIDSSAMNILPMVRKLSGNQFGDPIRLEASRNRISKDSLRTVPL
ncbi:hypothetical protein ABW21_db0201396 [Orbilia brochopaga]|nr:hypothetical protein ABW21_db0201396 [Drechslerella brochopaga]